VLNMVKITCIQFATFYLLVKYGLVLKAFMDAFSDLICVKMMSYVPFSPIISTLSTYIYLKLLILLSWKFCSALGVILPCLASLRCHK
jgi:hypothetical protein